MNPTDYKAHISSQFNAELEDVRQKVLAMGGLVEQQLIDATKALTDLNAELAEQVIENDDKVDHFEVTIDEECSRILALRQPTASDLRLVYAIVKTITDLERMGDEGHRIAKMARDLAQHRRVSEAAGDLRHLSRLVSRLVRNSLDAFARMDAEAALEVVRADKQVDAEYESLFRQGITYMMEEPRSIRTVIDQLWCARAMERIGDHAQNISEYVIYFVKGKDVRHVPIEDVEREVLGKR